MKQLSPQKRAWITRRRNLRKATATALKTRAAEAQNGRSPDTVAMLSAGVQLIVDTHIGELNRKNAATYGPLIMMHMWGDQVRFIQHMLRHEAARWSRPADQIEPQHRPYAGILAKTCRDVLTTLERQFPQDAQTIEAKR